MQDLLAFHEQTINSKYDNTRFKLWPLPNRGIGELMNYYMPPFNEIFIGAKKKNSRQMWQWCSITKSQPHLTVAPFLHDAHDQRNVATQPKTNQDHKWSPSHLRPTLDGRIEYQKRWQWWKLHWIYHHGLVHYGRYSFPDFL